MKNFKFLNFTLIAFLLFAMPIQSMATWGGSRCACGRHSHSWYCWYYGCSHYNCGGGNDIPLDGGLSFLLVAGAGLGVKKVVEKRKDKKNLDK